MGSLGLRTYILARHPSAAWPSAQLDPGNAGQRTLCNPRRGGATPSAAERPAFRAYIHVCSSRPCEDLPAWMLAQRLHLLKGWARDSPGSRGVLCGSQPLAQLRLGAEQSSLPLAAVCGQGGAARQVAAQGLLCTPQVLLALLQAVLQLGHRLLQLHGLPGQQASARVSSISTALASGCTTGGWGVRAGQQVSACTACRASRLQWAGGAGGGVQRLGLWVQVEEAGSSSRQEDWG